MLSEEAEVVYIGGRIALVCMGRKARPHKKSLDLLVRTDTKSGVSGVLGGCPPMCDRCGCPLDVCRCDSCVSCGD